MPANKLFNDPVYGLITVPRGILIDLIDHPWMQRLRRIKQLGLSHLVYPGAVHTRFHHALGALHLMTTTLDHLRKNGVRISDDEYLGAQIAILLHDVGHGPFSHCLEKEIILLPHEELTRGILHQLNGIFGGKLDLAIQIFENKYPRKFLSQLVSSQLDMDRMDYLNRDSFYTGVAEGVIGYDRLIKMMDVVDDHLVLEEKSIYSIEKFLMARRMMYWQVYMHKTSLVAEYLLKSFIGLIKNEKIQFTGFSSNLLDLLYLDDYVDFINDRNKLYEIYYEVDDSEVMILLKKALHSPHQKLRCKAEEILFRKFPKITIINQPPESDALEFLDFKEVVGNTTKVVYKNRFPVLSSGQADVDIYKAGKDEIIIKTKSNALIPLSECINLQQFSENDKKYYIIHT